MSGIRRVSLLALFNGRHANRRGPSPLLWLAEIHPPRRGRGPDKGLACDESSLGGIGVPLSRKSQPPEGVLRGIGVVGAGGCTSVRAALSLTLTPVPHTQNPCPTRPAQSSLPSIATQLPLTRRTPRPSPNRSPSLGIGVQPSRPERKARFKNGFVWQKDPFTRVNSTSENFINTGIYIYAPPRRCPASPA